MRLLTFSFSESQLFSFFPHPPLNPDDLPFFPPSFSLSACQRFKISAFSPKTVVVGEWVSSIDSTMSRNKKEIFGIDCFHAVSGIAGNPGIRYRSLSILPPQLFCALTVRNWVIGAWILGYEQDGADRAAYGERLVPDLAENLALPGLGASSLWACRQFFVQYPGIL